MSYYNQQQPPVVVPPPWGGGNDSGESGAGGAATAHGGGDDGNNGQYTAELSTYEVVYLINPELRTFDSSLQQRVSRVISVLAAGVEVPTLHLDSLREITSCKRDIWKSPELFDLVQDYFEDSLRTLDFCATLEKCLKNARDGQLIIHVALQRFADEEAAEAEAESDGKKYSRTLEELRHFKAAGDPFTEQFFQVFHSINRQHLSMLEKLQLPNRKLDKKLKSINVLRKVSTIFFTATFGAVLICSVVTAAVAAPTGLGAAASIPIWSMGKWIDSLLHNYQNAMKRQKELLSSMREATCIAIKDLDGIRVLIDRLEIQITSLRNNTEFSIKDEEAVKFGIDEIRKKMEAFMVSIVDLGEQADRCSRDIRKAMTVVLQRIIRNPESNIGGIFNFFFFF